MAHPNTLHFPFTRVASAAMLAFAGGAWAQSTTLQPVTITGRSDPAAAVSGWGTIPLSETPLQASIVTSGQLRDRGAQRLADVVRTDASISDGYNAEGYWDYIAVRGFVLDNKFNFRRDSLPISAETSIALDNKERIEILKGASGMQAGTSAPGGLVNYVVKRPTDLPAYSATIAWRERNTALAAVDLSQRFGAGAFGARVNLAYEHLDPQLREAQGRRRLAALATDWRAGSGTLVELEFEHSQRSQPSQPGFSMLGDRVPAPGDPRINLNNQPWSQPVVMDGNTGSVRLSHRFDGWRLSAHGATQRLRTDDRLAFPYGCGAENNYDRYCSDGAYDLYDFRSENERRRTDALELAASGDAKLAWTHHTWAAGVLQSRVRHRLGPQAYNQTWADAGETTPGLGNVDGTLVAYPNAVADDTNTNRDQRSTELFARDAIRLTDGVGVWLGLRHTRLHRRTVQTDGSEATDYQQSFTTPWFATTYTFAPGQLIYGSWGQGIESDVAPSREEYTNRGQALPAAKSRQLELGLKVSTQDASWGFAWFDIRRPSWANTGACDGSDDSCTRVLSGRAEHQGVEASAAWRSGAWAFQGSLLALRARIDSTGKRPPNVPHRTARAQARYHVPQVAGLSVQADVLGVSDRAVLDDNTASIPGYAVFDLGLRHEHKLDGRSLTWRAGVDNLFDRRAWRESPLQFGHVYLYPLAPRTFRVSLDVAL